MITKALAAANLLTSGLTAANELSLAPRVDGGTSATGSFASQAAERQVHACWHWHSCER